VTNDEFPRRITARERAVLDHMLEADFEGRDALRGQVEAVIAVRGCTCGCAAIDLEVDHSKAGPANVESRVPVDGWARTEDGTAYGLILFVDDGYLSCLEIYGTSTEPPSEFPAVDQLEPASARRG
jgi:hypothetical protein